MIKLVLGRLFQNSIAPINVNCTVDLEVVLQINENYFARIRVNLMYTYITFCFSNEHHKLLYFHLNLNLFVRVLFFILCFSRHALSRRDERKWEWVQDKWIKCSLVTCKEVLYFLSRVQLPEAVTCRYATHLRWLDEALVKRRFIIYTDLILNFMIIEEFKNNTPKYNKKLYTPSSGIEHFIGWQKIR